MDCISSHHCVPRVVAGRVRFDVNDRRVLWQQLPQITGEPLGKALEVRVATCDQDVGEAVLYQVSVSNIRGVNTNYCFHTSALHKGERCFWPVKKAHYRVDTEVSM